MILSDVSIRKALDEGRIVIDPIMAGAIQPSSVDLRVDRFFRVFRNHTTPHIDPKEPHEDLTELIEVAEDEPFVLHPGEFVLGSTLERVAVPDDLVGRLEGKSSLARLGLLIHSSLPASEPVLVLDGDGLVPRPIGEVVAKQLPGFVVGFHPETFEVGYHEITGWYEGASDRIYEVVLTSGRRVRVTAGHNLFTLDGDGNLATIRTGALVPGARVAAARRIPDPPTPTARIDLRVLAPESEHGALVCEGPTVATAFDVDGVGTKRALREAGYRHTDYYASRSRLPVAVASQLGVTAALGAVDRILVRGSPTGMPVVIDADEEIAWFLGLYVAVGSRRDDRFVVSSAAPANLDRVEAVLERLGLPATRAAGAVTCCCAVASRALEWLGTGGGAASKRVPPVVFGWPSPLVAAFLDGVVDGDGSRHEARTRVRTTSEGLVGDLLVLAGRLGRRARTTWQRRAGAASRCEVSMPTGTGGAEGSSVAGDLCWDEVVRIDDTGAREPVYDLEVRPGGRKVENFLAGYGGVFVSNTAGFVDAGWDGHLTLELSNVANLPIAIYPGMKIGQISFLQMTTAAEHPYGSGEAGSKYQGQRGPTPSRYYLNFRSGP